MSLETRVPVLIIGGGIVGLSASLFLSHHGIRHILVERHQGTSIHPRSRSVNARTMEFFRRLGIEDRVHEAGASMKPTGGIYSGHSLKEVIEPMPRKEGGMKWPIRGIMSQWSPVNGCFVTQDMLEPVLVDVARERGGDLRFNTEATDVKQDDDGVSATLKDRSTGATSSIRADYLIAADGAGSPIRNQLNIQQSGQGAIGHLLNILFKADLNPLVKNREFSLCDIKQPEFSGLITAIDNNDKWVFHLCYDPSKGEKPSDFPPERCRDILQRAVGIPNLEIEVKSILPWEPSERVATRYQEGRIFLVGDAAHQMTPYAGQGGNSGIAEVHNLSWKLASVLNGHSKPSLLESYEPERLPVAQFAAKVSADAADNRGIIDTKKSRFIYNLLWRIHIMSGHGYNYSKSPTISPESTFPLGGITWRPWTVSSLGLGMDGSPGTRCPHLWIKDPKSGEEEKKISTLDLLGKSLVLLTGSNPTSSTSWKNAAKKLSSDYKISIASYSIGSSSSSSSSDIIPADPSSSSFESLVGISPHGAILVRPDDFITWRSRRMVGDCERVLGEGVRRALCL